MVDERRAEDEVARKAARSEFTRPIVLRAGAGTGKTAALVARIVAWCLGPGWRQAHQALAYASPTAEEIARRTLRRVVAITFTEAAAAEMAERVAVALHAISMSQEVVGLPAEELDSEAAARALTLFAAIDMLEVRTIHAWCRGLLAKYPIEAGIHPNFVVDADGTATSKVIRDVVETELRALLDDSDNASLLHLFGHGIHPSDIEAAVARLVYGPDSVLEELGNRFSDKDFEDYRDHFMRQVEAVRELVHDCFRGVRAPNASKLHDALGTLYARLPKEDDFVGLRAAVEEEIPGTLRRHLDKSWVRGEGGKSERAAIAPIFPRLREYCETLSLMLEEAGGFHPETYETAAKVIVPMTRKARAVLQTNGILGFNDLLHLTHQLLSREGVASRVRAGIDQLLVDEFQDTDMLQCGIVRALTARGKKETRPGLFIVGDPKQSIYGWRNADLQAYEDFVEEVLQLGGKEYRLILNFRSYGNVLKEVDRCMERLMKPEPGIQPQYESLIAQRGQGPDESCVEVWVSNPWEHDEPQVGGSAVLARNIEAKAIAEEALRLMEKGERLSEIGILFRSMSDVDVYQKAMRDVGVPYEVTRDQQYYRRVEIIEACALIRALVDPTDQVAAVTLLRSSMVRVPDGALLSLWCEGFPKSWLRLGRDPQALLDICVQIDDAAACLMQSDPELRVAGWSQHLKTIVRRVCTARTLRSHTAPDEWIHHVRTAFMPDVVAASQYQGVYRVANLEQFFRRVSALVVENGGDWSSLNRTLRDSVQEQQDAEEARPSDRADAVQLLTIHKSKGLAFKHTFIVDMHHRIRQRERPRGTYVHRDYGTQLVGCWPPGFRFAWRRSGQVSHAEGIRLLYVAMTRARDRIVLAGAWPAELRETKRPRTSLDYLAHRNPPHVGPWALAQGDAHEELPKGDGVVWRFIGRDFDINKERGNRRPKRTDNFQFHPIPETRRLWAGKTQEKQWSRTPSSTKSEDVASRSGLSKADALRVGTAIHALIEQIDNVESANRVLRADGVSAALAKAYGGDPVANSAKARAILLAERFRSGSLLQRLCRMEILGREVPILLDGGSDGPVAGWVGALDLLYRNPATGHVVVADFKTDAVDATDLSFAARAHQEQGRIYVETVRRAMGLDYTPNFEVWFLDADAYVVLECSTNVRTGADPTH